MAPPGSPWPSLRVTGNQERSTGRRLSGPCQPKSEPHSLRQPCSYDPSSFPFLPGTFPATLSPDPAPVLFFHIAPVLCELLLTYTHTRTRAPFCIGLFSLSHPRAGSPSAPVCPCPVQLGFPGLSLVTAAPGPGAWQVAGRVSITWCSKRVIVSGRGHGGKPRHRM